MIQNSIPRGQLYGSDRVSHNNNDSGGQFHQPPISVTVPKKLESFKATKIVYCVLKTVEPFGSVVFKELGSKINFRNFLIIVILFCKEQL